VKFRLGILVSHPIQYLAPWFRYLAERLDIEVFYAHRQRAQGQAQAGFGVEFDWDVPLLDGYRYRWLTNVARQPSVRSFNGCDTPEIYEILRRERFDAFLVFGWNRKSAIQAIRGCRRTHTPVLLRGDSQLMTHRSWIRSAMKHIPYRWFLPRLDAHLYVGRRNKDYLRRYGVPEAKLFFVPHCVDNASFAEGAQRAETAGACARLRAELNIPPDAFVFLYVGKMIAKKRPADFLQACRRVLSLPEGTSSHALLVGDGPMRPLLEHLALPYARQIHFAGFRHQNELPACYKASNALVLPGEESWGLVVNEAFACGIPAVVSDAAGCAPDLIDDGRTGYTYPMGAVEALARRLLSMKKICEAHPIPIRQALSEKVSVYSIGRASEGLETALRTVTAAESKSSF
jgi:glycosyltransferase involved in cell wall biosynthesis